MNLGVGIVSVTKIFPAALNTDPSTVETAYLAYKKLVGVDVVFPFGATDLPKTSPAIPSKFRTKS